MLKPWRKYLLCFGILLCLSAALNAQILGESSTHTHADTLRGSINPNRDWWNVLRYDVSVKPDFKNRTISGHCDITFGSNGGDTMQIDLQQPMVVDSVLFNGQQRAFERAENIILVEVASAKSPLPKGEFALKVYYHGQPTEAKNPPWDGGWIFTTDRNGNPWMTVACQGLGASVWYPCKDHQSDEPDRGASITITVPTWLTAVANGKLTKQTSQNGLSTFNWEVKNPINSYNLVPYIGQYENFSEVYEGEKGKLTCNYWVLKDNVKKAKKQFEQTSSMLKAFEHWFGPYPFYEDGFKLVEAPHLGMEHQSAIAYGNGFENGYRGRDLSSSGWGLKWDYVLVHESGHEWFGNNITTNDIADMWVHESFTTYSEVLFTEYAFGKTAGSAYLRGLRSAIDNDKPIIGTYGVNKSGSGDMYFKGANMLHTLRTCLNNDSLFRQLLRQMNVEFYHKTVTGEQIEAFWERHTGGATAKLFDQYLRTTQVPTVSYNANGKTLNVSLTNCVADFGLNLWIPTSNTSGQWQWVQQGKMATVPCQLTESELMVKWSKEFYVEYKPLRNAKRRR